MPKDPEIIDAIAVPVRPGKARREPQPGEKVTGNAEPVAGLCNSINRFGLHCPKSPHLPGRNNNRCFWHGGRVPSGAASPAFKHGRYINAMPQRMLPSFVEADEDETLLALRSDISLVSARIDDLMSRAEKGEAGATWLELQKRWRDFSRYRAAGDIANMQAALLLLEEPIKAGVAEQLVWKEIGEQLDRRQRLVEAERRRLEQTENTMTMEDVRGVLKATLEIIERNVTDRVALTRIGVELEELVSGDARVIAVRGGGKKRRRA